MFQGSFVEHVAGYVYIIRTGLRCKVGYSDKPFHEQREKQYKTHNPESRDVLFHAHGTVSDERRLHDMFSAYRVTGTREWYDLPIVWQQFIRQLYLARQANEGSQKDIQILSSALAILKQTHRMYQRAVKLRAVDTMRSLVKDLMKDPHQNIPGSINDLCYVYGELVSELSRSDVVFAQTRIASGLSTIDQELLNMKTGRGDTRAPELIGFDISAETIQ